MAFGDLKQYTELVWKADLQFSVNLTEETKGLPHLTSIHTAGSCLACGTH